MSGPFGPRLRRPFYARPTLRVARDLLGKTLVVRGPDGTRAVRLVEVEAYLGAGRDPASHAHRGPTPRTLPMFGPPGRTYVYLVYGMHWCLNVVAHPAAAAGAVLLRGAEPIAGMDVGPAALAGPGRLARGIGVSGAQNDLDLVRGSGGSAVSIHDAPPVAARRVGRGARVGIVPGETADRPWRLYVVGSAGVSRTRTGLGR